MTLQEIQMYCFYKGDKLLWGLIIIKVKKTGLKSHKYSKNLCEFMCYRQLRYGSKQTGLKPQRTQRRHGVRKENCQQIQQKLMCYRQLRYG